MKNSIALSASTQYYDLGTFGRPISTNNKDAQAWFNRGLTWSYGFNHDASAECFEQATLHDPSCAMAYWGLAYALGPNYNKPWEVFDKTDLQLTLERTYHAAEQAQKYAASATPVEQALAGAIRLRFQKPDLAADRSKWNREYADAMAAVHKQFPDDLDAVALYADAAMSLTPWQLWDIKTGKPNPKARTVEAKAVLEAALAHPAALQHPGILHFYIHLMEMSNSPELALAPADNLRNLIPDAGHLRHMPAHLDILCGDYRRAIASNLDAVVADDKYLAGAGPFNFYTMYRCHDVHFVIYAAMFSGQSRIALQAVDKLESIIPEDLLHVRSPPMANWLESFFTMRVHVMVRFGMWQELINMPMPHDGQLYCVTSSMLLYAKAVAFAATGRIEEAIVKRTEFRTSLVAVPKTRMQFNNTCRDILKVASAMLDGELEYRRGSFERAFEHLQRSTDLSDSLPYEEPWGWMQPTRHAYGALLLEQGHVSEAALVYAADLGLDNSLPRAVQHPNNVWALHGYHECLVKLGRNAEAHIVAQQLKLAEAVADVPIRSSCFCRRHAAGETIQASPSECCSAVADVLALAQDDERLVKL